MEMVECRQNLRNNKKIQEAVKTILEEIGEDPNREGLKRTPYRIAKAYEEWFGGYGIEAKDVLNRQFTESCGIVLEGPISFYSHCEHHVAAFFGMVWIAYIPKKYVTGLDKLVKLVEIYSRRLQIQEKMCSQIADTLNDVLQPQGVGVVIVGKHLCMCSRGVKNQSSEMITSAMRGKFKDQQETRNEFLQLIQL